MSRQEDIALTAVRKSTLRSLKEKKASRLAQIKRDYEAAVREVEIQYDEDPERLKAKYAAADYAKSEKARKRAEAKIAREKTAIEIAKKYRPFTLAEEIASAIVQGIGACLFVAATACLETLAIRNAVKYVNLTTVMYALFGATMIIMYVFSCLRHSITNRLAKDVFNRLSHFCSFLIIGWGYTAYTITKIEGQIGWTLFGIVWGLSLIGAIMFAISGERLSRVNLALYIIAGFSGIFVCRILYNVLSPASFQMLIMGAVFYIIGLVFYGLRKYRFMHFIGNILMLVANVNIFFSLFFINS